MQNEHLQERALHGGPKKRASAKQTAQKKQVKALLVLLTDDERYAIEVVFYGGNNDRNMSKEKLAALVASALAKMKKRDPSDGPLDAPR